MKNFLSCILVCFLLSCCLSGCTQSSNVLMTTTEDTNEAENNPIQFEESQAEEYPEYDPLDYVVLPDDVDQIQVSDVKLMKTSDYLVEKQIAKLCKYNGIEYTDLQSLTNENVAMLSNQKYQDVDSYIESITSQVDNYLQYRRHEQIFDEISRKLAGQVEIDEVPQDVYDYVTSEDSIRAMANTLGYNDEAIDALYDGQTEDFLMDTLIEEANVKLLSEMVIGAMSEKYDIATPTDDAWEIMMYKYACINRDDLLQYFNEHDLMCELCYIDVVNYFAGHADIISDTDE